MTAEATSQRRPNGAPAAPPGGATIRVIGCGNRDDGDDGIGLVAVRALRRRLVGRHGIQVVEAATGLHVLDLLADARVVVVVDAVHSAGRMPPGTPVRAEAGPDGLPAELSGSVSTHGLGVADAVALGASLGRLPRMVFLGLEVADLRPGAPLSPPVAAAVPAFVALIEAEVDHLLETERP